MEGCGVGGGELGKKRRKRGQKIREGQKTFKDGLTMTFQQD